MSLFTRLKPILRGSALRNSKRSTSVHCGPFTQPYSPDVSVVIQTLSAVIAPPLISSFGKTNVLIVECVEVLASIIVMILFPIINTSSPLLAIISTGQLGICQDATPSSN